MKNKSKVILILLIMVLVSISFGSPAESFGAKSQNKYVYVKIAKSNFTAPLKVTKGSKNTGKRYYPIKKNKKYKGRYKLTPGIYSYTIASKKYYDIVQTFRVPKSLKGKKMLIKATAYKTKHGNYELNHRIYQLPSKIVNAALGTKSIKGYSTFGLPGFSSKKLKHEFASLDEIKKYAKTRCNNSQYLTYYENEQFGIPVIVFSSQDLSSAETYLDAARLLSTSDKVNVYYQAQIHGNEPAGCEGALAIIDSLSKEYGKSLAENVNIIIIPRVNNIGAKAFSRNADKGIDANRGFMNIRCNTSNMICDLFDEYMPHVTIDGHEYRSADVQDFSKNKKARIIDVRLGGTSSANVDPSLRNISFDMLGEALSSCKKSNISTGYFSYDSNVSIERTYFSLHQCVSLLVESRGLDMGKLNYGRRVFSHYLVAKSFLDYCNINDQEIKNAVEAARNQKISKTSNVANNMFVLNEKPNAHKVNFSVNQYDTNLKHTLSNQIYYLETTVQESRKYATAYIIPTNNNISSKFEPFLERKHIKYYKRSISKPINLGIYNMDFNSNSFTLTNYLISIGSDCYIIPTNQFHGLIIQTFMEPGYCGTGIDGYYHYSDKIVPYYSILRYDGDLSDII